MNETLFADLELLAHEEIEERCSDFNRELRSLEDEFYKLKDERKSQVELVQSLWVAVGGIEEANSERKALLRRFHDQPSPGRCTTLHTHTSRSSSLSGSCRRG